MTAVPPLAERLHAVRDGIADAAREASRDVAEITTIVVTKFHPATMVRELHDLGVRDFGESRHQEAQPKIADLADLDATWHFVGQLQSKKARQVAAYVDVIHSVDRDSLATAIAGYPLEVFIQVNLTEDSGRGGAEPEAIHRLAEHLEGAAGLTLRGLMAVAPLGGEARAAFARLRQLSEQLVQIAPRASALSMGMSGDYRDAILEGATHLRIGTAITGKRPEHG
ncbi:YggS family pyridoxal phosphate-dependent enzyme [Salinibacterium sp. G-O1]|uniref:YggS family pyridoxal phosphate-dependent enzyme n=1 Tax=Salinibacterium sp. G-O1 TaxID=3046208 RepID=UPI0024BA151E|nr:YggS family pyridoxal phosphate-dependent enzyme [Salinibacterium sp. G-O1]MDJ0334996.1 YggS family pyridoxal phosphate-dependent enzyme [Salinibacterium sp. G-O1]